MTKTGGKRHLKRPASPKVWPISRKGSKFVTKIRPGPHSKSQGMPLIVLLRDVLGVAESKREVKYILTNERVEVDGRIRKDLAFPVGHMDVVHLKGTDKYYRIQYHKSGKLRAFEIPLDEASTKLCKVVGKRNLRNNKTQISLHDGRNVLLENGDKRLKDIKVNGSLLIEIPSQEIKEIYKFEESSLAMVTEGHHQGKMGSIIEINKRFGPNASEVTFSTKEEESFSTSLHYVFIIGEDTPAITLVA